ncbi:MAG: sigma-70 family RNA polymerase sigma factor [Candidatus Brocadiae bacterium]|nr:sigma-70 family RNA polymerase sigma factor [Candidatus Brocadiia bacterium]
MGHEDRELARRCREGDTAAYTELMRRHRRMVFGIVYAILGCPEEAEDVAQEAFVRAYRAIGRYDPRFAFATWVRRIAVNRAISRLKGRERTREVERAAGRLTVTREEEPEEHVVAGDLTQRVRAAIETLPTNQRVAITLFGLEGMTLAETAEAIGCSVGAVKSHLHRARGKLADQLSDHLTGD